MARALVITHTEAETPGTLADWLPAAGVELVECRPWAGEAVPTALAGFDALVVMGGPQQAYDDTSAVVRPVSARWSHSDGAAIRR